MRGKDESRGSLFSYADLDARVPRGHAVMGNRNGLPHDRRDPVQGHRRALRHAGAAAGKASR